MSTRVVISDAGPLIALAKVGALQILRQLFESVSITSVVLAEILPESADFPEKPLLAQMLNEGWVHILESTRDQGDPPVIGLIPAARPVLEAMVRAGYFIGKAHIDAVLKSTGEC